MSLYNKYTKVIEAEFPRWKQHSTIPSGIPLSIVFDHYTLTNPRKNENKIPINLFFLSGTGMTKAVWIYHIKRLFQYSEENQHALSWQLVNCIAIDQVNHGESAVENMGKLGWEFDWREGAHDLIQVAKAQKLIGVNVLVGHSMGGFQSLYITTVAPLLFRFTVVIEPITHNHPTQSGLFGAKIIPALAKVLRSEFESENDFYDYFFNKSIYKKLNKEILNDFAESEKFINKDGSVVAKTSAKQQLITYRAGMTLWSETDDYVPKHVSIPVVYVIGENANWNVKERVEEMLTFIPDVEKHVVPKGEHLVNLEQPDEILKIIKDSLNKRIKSDDDWKKNKQLAFNSEEYQKIFDESYKVLHDKYFVRKGKL